MAGITLIYQQRQKDISFLMKLVANIEKMPDVHILMQEKEFLLIKKSKAHYPVQLIDHSEYVFVIEGRIYGVDTDTDDAFKLHLLGLFDTHKKDESLKYIRSLDGEFLIYLFHKATRKVLVVNDFLGRIPAYYMQNDLFILSRDINLVQILIGKLSFDVQAVYEFLRLGYPLGNKTLFKSLNRLPPSSYFILDKEVNMQSQSFSLEEWQESGRCIKKPVEQLYEIFKEALINRIKDYKKPMLSISGGLDSRIIMGEIEKEKQSVAYESFLYENTIIESDVAVVKKLCSLYKTQFGLTELEEWSPGYFDELIDAKFGMNYLGMAFIVPFLKGMAQKYDVMLTGDGGDKTLAYLFPEKTFFKSDVARLVLRTDVARLVLRTNEITSEKDGQQILGIDTVENEEVMRAHLDCNYYKDTKLNYKHFLLFERAKNWLFEGEDRNRQYIWSTSPFYHPGFFQMVHSLDERKKQHFKLYRSFTHLIYPELNKITNANWGFTINETGNLRRLLCKQSIKQHIKSILPPSQTNHQVPEEMLDTIKDQLQGNMQEEFFNKKLNVNELSKESLFHLLTVLKIGNKLS